MAHPTLDDFFSTALDYYLIPDLVRLRKEIRPDRGPKKDQEGCTIATAMFVFSLLDLIGFLIRPDASPCKTDTHRNIAEALCKDADLFPERYSKDTPVLVKLFRHGMMHQVFPKACGISKPYPPNRELIFYSADGTPNLNVDVLVDDLLKAFKRLRKRVAEDEPLATTMERRLVFLQQEDSALMQKMKRKGVFPESGAGSMSVTTVTTTTPP